MPGVRVVASKSNVDKMFSKATIDYEYSDNEGVQQTVPMPVWVCKTCNWYSLYGFNGLPMVHECELGDSQNWSGVASHDVKFSS